MANWLSVGQHLINMEQVSRVYVDEVERKESPLSDTIVKMPRASIYFMLQTADQAIALVGPDAIQFLAAFRSPAETKAPKSIRGGR